MTEIATAQIPTTPATLPARWTVAFRKPKANRFRRVSGLAMQRQDAVDLASKLGSRFPDREFRCVQTAADADVPNLLTGTGKRVRIVETDGRPDEVTSKALVLRLDEVNRRIREWGKVGDTMQQLGNLMAQRYLAEEALAAE